MSSPFHERVKSFNQMYGLDAPGIPTYTTGLQARLMQFKKIILDEISEVDDIIMHLQDGALTPEGENEVLTMLSDWLGDIIVYAASEMTRHGIPIEGTLSIIMDSNDSKLGEDGKPIVKDGKVQKGPNYWRPEPKLKELIIALKAAGAWEMKQ